MTHSPRARSRARAIQVGTAAAAVLALAVASGQSYAAGSGSAPVRGEAGHKAGSASPSGFYDSSRGQGSGARARELRTASKANDRAATTQFRASLPGDAILDIDGSTGSTASSRAVARPVPSPSPGGTSPHTEPRWASPTSR